MTRRVYLDNHATTPVDPSVVEAMLPYFTEHFGNPGSIGHAYGEEARAAVDAARKSIASSFHVSPDELIFTSGATESNNLVIRGVAERNRDKPMHMVSVTTEHKAVLDPLQRLRKLGVEVTLVEPEKFDQDQPGFVSPMQVADAIREDTVLVSVMFANNEIGVIQPLGGIAGVCRQRGVPLHTDATQAVGKIPLNFAELDVDLVSFSGHKVYGPRGIGGLIVRRRRPRIRLAPLLDGGGQEHGLRSGTLNVPAIVGLSRAIEICDRELTAESTRISMMREKLWTAIQDQLGGVHLNGPRSDRLPGNLNVRFDGVDGEALMLNMRGVAVSSGSACTSANPEPSHVLLALGLSDDQTRSSLRFGIGRFNTEDDMDVAAATVVKAVTKLRSLV